MSITLTKIPNPFQPEINIVEMMDYIEGKQLSHYISDLPLYEKDIKFIIAINGKIIQEPYNIIVKDGDIISACAKTEWLAAAKIAAYVAGAYIKGSIVYGIVYAVVFVAAMFVIGYGMAALASALAPSKDSIGDTEDTQVASVYGWNALSQSLSEGTNMPILFGANKIAGQVLNQFISLSGDKETLNILLGICDHEIDSISDIKLNDQPYTYFKDTTVTADRLGTNSDTVISGFDEIVTQVNVGSKLEQSAAVTQDTGGTSVEKLIIFITAPNGLYYSNDQGGLSTRSAIFTVEYQIKDAGSWTNHPSSPFTMSGATTSTQREMITIDSLSANQYTVRITRTNTAESSHRGNSDIYFTSLQEIVKESLIYPGLAKYAINALATDQLSGGIPRVTCIATRGSISIFDYELETHAWTNKRATNPAWICYSLLVWELHIDKDRLVWSDFNDWADYCDEIVDSEYRHIINVVITGGNFWEQLQKIAHMGRGAVIRRSTKYGVFIDKEETVISHLFTMGNIIEETFKLQYLPQKDRANAIELEYTDVDRDYTRQVISVYSNEYLLDETNGQSASISMEASMSKEEVIREGVFIINSNKYLIRVITFDAAIDSFGCIVGDLFYFQHETVDYEAGKVGSRIINAGNDDGSGNPYVQLDQEVVIETAVSYRITVRLSDDSLIEKIVNNSPETTDTLTLTTSWIDIPEKYDIFLFGIADTYLKTYRLTSVTKSDDFTRTITGLEYIPEIYTENSSYVIEVPTWTTRKQKALQVSLHEFLSYEDDGSFKSVVNVSWHRAYTQTGANWSIWLEDTTAGTDPINMGISYENSFLIDTGLVLGNSYTVYVVSLDEGATDTGDNTETITILGKQAPPDDIAGFNGTWDSIKRQVLFTWTANTNLDLAYYEIRSGGTWAGGTVVAEPTTNYTSIFIDEGVSESIAYRIKAFDTSGIESTTEDVDTVAIDTADCPLSTPTGLDWTSASTIVSDGRDAVMLLASWTDSSGDSDDWNIYELQLEDMSVNKLSQFATQNNHFQIEVMPNHSYGVTIRSVDFSLNHTAWTTQVVHTTTKDASAPATPTWPGSDYAIAGFKVIGLNWDDNTEYDLSHYILERSTVSDFSSAITVLGTIKASFHSDSYDLEVATQYYYRLMAVDTSQNSSGYSAIISETTLLVGTTDIAVDAIIATHISVDNIAAINADLGTITAGRIQNAGNTTYLDLSNDLMALGSGLTWDGVNLEIVGTLTIGSGSSGYADLSDIPTELSDINTTEGTKLTGIEDGADITDYTKTATIALVDGTAYTTITGNTAKKTSGANAFDADVYSLNSFTGGAVLRFQAITTTEALMVGINPDPETDHSNTSIDYCFYMHSTAVVYIYESGSNVASLGAYTTDTIFEIKYNGSDIIYSMDGVIQRTVSSVGPGLEFFIDSSMYLDAEFRILSFEPYADVTPALPSDENLAGYWSFDEISGTEVKDSSVNGNDGTLVNSPSWVTGISGSGLEFNGLSAEDRYVTMGTASDLDSTEITVCAWIYPYSFVIDGTNSRGIVTKYAGSSTNLGYLLQAHSTGLLRWWTDTDDIIVSDAGALVIDQWQHVAVTHSTSNVVTMYIDGIEVNSSGTASTITSVGNDFIIGRLYEDSGSYYFDGKIDEVRVYDSVLTASEIKALYLNPSGLKSPVPGADISPSLPSDENLQGYWSLDEGTWTEAKDSSLNGNHGTITGASWISGVSGSALDFGGGVTSGDMIELDSPYEIDLLSSTISFWAQRNVLETTQDGTNTVGALRLLASDTTGSSHFLESRITASNFALYGERDVNSEYWANVTTNVVADINLHHFVIVNDSNIATIYIDGVLAATKDHSETGYTSNTCTITHIGMGYSVAHASYGSFWDGLLDEIRFYDSILTEQEVKALYLNPGGLKAPIPGADVTMTQVGHASDMTQIDGGKIYAGSDITIGNTVDGDYSIINSGDIEFYQYLDSSHRLTKSLKRIEIGSATSGTLTALPGYWDNAPNVMISPLLIKSYDYSENTVDQALYFSGNIATEISGSPDQYEFTPTAQLVYGDEAVGGTLSGNSQDTSAATNTEIIDISLASSLGVTDIEEVTVTVRAMGYRQLVYASTCGKDATPCNMSQLFGVNLAVKLEYYNGSWQTGLSYSAKKLSTGYAYPSWSQASGTSGTDITQVRALVKFTASDYGAAFTSASETGLSTRDNTYIYIRMNSWIGTKSGYSVIVSGTLNWIAVG